MARRPSTKITAKPVLILLVLAGFYLAYEKTRAPRPTPIPTGELPTITDARFVSLSGAALASSGGNDGDSFKARLPDGREETFRLYFVDTPETSDRYPDRIRYQSEYFDDISPAQTIAVGTEAKKFTLDLLNSHPFVILTRWESVMESYRYHAFVLVETEPGRMEYLSEVLIRKGLARIYTMPADLPDGTPKEQFKSHLKSLESQARSDRSGAWRF
jgi:endonuclease YncB( thermonuclease family)